MRMRVLVTGGAGFIGSHLVEHLLARGDEVLVIDNYETGRRDNLAPHPRLEVLEGSIADSTLVDRAFERFRPERVAHAAASYKNPDDWSEDARTNVVGTAHVVRAAERTGVGRLVYFQTALCYGLHPIEQPITLAHPIRPEGSSYAISKTAAEHYVRLSSLDWISLRLANVYGPRNLSGPLPTFHHRLTRGKPCYVADTRRDFLFVGDLIDLVAQALDGKGPSGPYHVSSGTDVSIKDLFDAVRSALRIPDSGDVEVRPRSPGDAATILLDPAETRDAFGWSTRTSLIDGVAAAVRWYERFGIEQTYTHLTLEPARRE